MKIKQHSKENRAASDHTKVCVIGVGFVGLTLSISLCDAGFEVYAWEKNPKLKRDLSQGSTDLVETGIQGKLSKYVVAKRFQVIDNWQEAAAASVYIITVGTPLTSGVIDLSHITEALTQLKFALKDDDLVVIRSTTAIGTCRELIWPFLQSSNKRIRLAMCPERTVEGRALEEMSSLPQIIGAVDEESYLAASKFFSVLGPEIVRVGSLEAAELTKLINNTYRDLMFGFANEIASVANAFNVNPSEVIRAANHNYERSNIALPGISGGPCLDKDPWILVQSALKKGLDLEISKSSRIVNENIVNYFLNHSLPDSLLPRKIAVLGLAFKGNPVTKDLRGSAIYPLVKYLTLKYPEARLVGFDPAGIQDVPNTNIEVMGSIESCIAEADLVILLTNSRAFGRVPSLISKYSSENCLTLDFWKRDFLDPFYFPQEYFSWAG
jgi:UDP-N-acetyl-D-mannosaminuronic acid dehydrogenase